MEENQQKLNRAFSIARCFKLPGFAIGLWFVFYPEPFDVALWLVILLPLLIIGVARFSKSFDAKETPNSGSPYMPMFAKLIVPGIALWARGVLYDIADRKLQWLMIGAIVLVLFLVVVYRNVYFRQQTFMKLTGRLALVLVPLFLYAYGLTAMLNCYYDKAEATIYRAVVLEKHEELFKKRQRYYVRIGGWGEKTEPETIEVRKDFFVTKEANDSVDILYRPGLLHIGWYRLRQF